MSDLLKCRCGEEFYDDHCFDLHLMECRKTDAAFIQSQQQRIEALEAKLSRCKEVMECNDPMNHNLIFTDTTKAEMSNEQKNK